MFVPGKPFSNADDLDKLECCPLKAFFQPNQMYASKAGAYLSGAPERLFSIGQALGLNHMSTSALSTQELETRE